jgi:hypothetical protein
MQDMINAHQVNNAPMHNNRAIAMHNNDNNNNRTIPMLPSCNTSQSKHKWENPIMQSTTMAQHMHDSEVEARKSS